MCPNRTALYFVILSVSLASSITASAQPGVEYPATSKSSPILLTNKTHFGSEGNQHSVGRILISGPNSWGGPLFNQIHQFDLRTGQRSIFASFTRPPSAMTLGQDGHVYVLLDQLGDAIYKLNRLTGALLDTIPIPAPVSKYPFGIARKPNGDFLIYLEDLTGSGNGEIRQYGSDGAFLGVWAPSINTGRSLQITPSDTVVIAIGHPDFGSVRLVEFDLGGTVLREIITAGMNERFDGIVFRRNSEILISNRSSQCIKRFDVSTTPATFLGDCVCDPNRIGANLIAINPLTDDILATHHESGCIWAWNSQCNSMYGGSAIGECYAPFLALGYMPIAIADDCNTNGVEDGFEIESGQAPDCNSNRVPDSCDIVSGKSVDCDENQVPDECQVDSDGDGQIDDCDADRDGDGVPNDDDACPDNRPGLPVSCDGRPLRDCNGDCNVDGLDLQCIVNELLGT